MQKTVSINNLAQTTHSMQNLLMLLKAHVEGLSDKLKSSPPKQQLISKETEAIYANVDRLSKLMNSLTIYKNVKENMDLLQSKQFDLSKLLSDIVQEYREAFPYFSFRTDIPKNAAFVGDAKKITIVLRNILENAIKYCQKKSKKSPVFIGLRVVKKNYEFSIRDSGIGIPPQDIPKVFLPFYRGRKGINEQGSGLGLAIAREIVQFHRGKITLTSKINVGTEVKIVLPNSLSS